MKRTPAHWRVQRTPVLARAAVVSGLSYDPHRIERRRLYRRAAAHALRVRLVVRLAATRPVRRSGRAGLRVHHGHEELAQVLARVRQARPRLALGSSRRHRATRDAAARSRGGVDDGRRPVRAERAGHLQEHSARASGRVPRAAFRPRRRRLRLRTRGRVRAACRPGASRPVVAQTGNPPRFGARSRNSHTSSKLGPPRPGRTERRASWRAFGAPVPFRRASSA